MHAIFASLALLLIAATSYAQTRVVDGDTITVEGKHYRLHGIDAPELKQSCNDQFPAGYLAAAHLRKLIAGRDVTCSPISQDRYGRTIALCRAGEIDLQSAMVRAGWAWAYVHYSRDYIAAEKSAKADRLGVHAYDCQPAWDWRRSH